MTIADGAHTRSLLAGNAASAQRARASKRVTEAAERILRLHDVSVEFGAMTFEHREAPGTGAVVRGGIIGGALVIDQVEITRYSPYSEAEFAEAVSLRLLQNAAERTARLREKLAVRNAIAVYYLQGTDAAGQRLDAAA